MYGAACYEEDGTYFSSGKIGSGEFCDVVIAVYALYELYDENVGFTQIDGEIVEISPCVGWIIHVLGTKFSIKKRFCLWKYFGKYCLDRTENGDDDPAKYYDVMAMVPPDLYTAMGGTDFSDIWYIGKGTGSLCSEELVPGSYPDMIYKCRELHEEAYTDEEMTGYASDELAEERKAAIEKAIDGKTTAEYLRQDGSLTFWNTPEELKGKPDYYLSDDDRAFWWDGSGEVVFSKEMDELLSLLEETENLYKRVYCFQDMFYEFLQNGRDKRYVAAVRLLGRLVQENREKGKVIEHMKMGWDITSRNVTHNEGRMAIKRYLSVMANRGLRKQYFGF